MIVLQHNIWHMEHIKIIIMARLIYMKMSLITKLQKLHTKLLNYKNRKGSSFLSTKSKSFCSPKSFLIFGGPSIKFFINQFVTKRLFLLQICKKHPNNYFGGIL